MPPNSSQFAPEEAVAQDRKFYLVGRFKVYLNQTRNHPDQRALDQSWVDSLVEQIGDPGVLNRALHPVGVILDDDSSVAKLRQVLEINPDKKEVPELPQGVVVLVFSGQHRLAMLAQLELTGPECLWWHADVYMRALELKHPAEFLTMMHESNTPKIMKQASDIDLFRAVVKLKDLMDTKTINQEVFLRNRRALLNFDKNTSRCISSLTRNHELAQAIMQALSKVHIASVFSAGSWRRLTTGRLYMVSAGIVKEMVKQVDLLCEGMIEVPKEVLTLQPSQCRISSLEGVKNRRKKSSHAWDVLPGGLLAALRRAKTRPLSFVSSLNPKTRDPWSFPELIMLPSCLGASVVEDELKMTQKLMQHLLKMTSKPEHLEKYTSNLPDPMEADTDHPAGIIAHTLRAIHGENPKIVGYECKIIQATWLHRAELTEELKANNIPDYQEANRQDYELLLKKSKPWWDILYIFKIRRFPFGLKLEVSKEFETGVEIITDKVEGPVNPTPSKKRSQASGEGTSEVPPKRRKSSKSTGGASQGGIANMDDGDEEPPQGSISSQADGHDNMDDEFPGGDNDAVSIRRGGDRQLGKVIADLSAASQNMSRAESRALTGLLEGIIKAQQSGKLEELVGGLIDHVKDLNISAEQEEDGTSK